MRELKLVIIVVALCMFLLFLKFSGNLSCTSVDYTENYGSVLGQLAPYQEQLNECVSQCEKTDPNTRLLPQANINCGRYCEFVMTEFANKGTHPASIPINNTTKKCEKQCNVIGSTENEQRKCVSMCEGRNEIAKWCKELWCPYSLFDEDKCMNWCTSTGNINNNQVSWEWAMSR